MPPRLFISHHKDWNDETIARATAAGYSVTVGKLDNVDLSAFDAIVPFHLGCQRVVREWIASGRTAAALVVSQEAEDLCHDKLAFNRRAISLGFGRHIPQIIQPGQVSKADFPLILKHRNDAWGSLSRIVHNSEDIVFFTAEDNEYFLQRYIPGSEEYATHLLLKDGRIMFHATHLYRWARTPYVQGRHDQPPAGEWLETTPALETFERLLGAIGYRSGSCCIDYRLVNDIPLIFEINPRFGGSLIHRLGDYLHAYVGALTSPCPAD